MREAMVSESGLRMVPTRSHGNFANEPLLRPLPAHVRSQSSNRNHSSDPDQLRWQQTTDLEAACHLSDITGEPDVFSRAVDRGKGQTETKDLSNTSRKMKSKAFVEPLASQVPESSDRSYFIHICWEHAANDQRALVVEFSNPEDEKEIYKNMRQTWYRGRQWWLKFVPFYDVIGIEEVEFRHLQNHQNYSSVLCRRLDTSGMKAQLVRDLVATERSVSAVESGRSSSCPLQCYEDLSTGVWDHDGDCLSNWEPVSCPYQTAEDCRQKLDKLEWLSLPLLYFKDPNKADGKRTLAGIAQQICIYQDSLVMTRKKGNESDMRSIEISPPVADRRYPGLMITTGYKLQNIDNSAVAISIVLLWKAFGGNWEAAFAAGAFYIMLVTLSPRPGKEKESGRDKTA